MADCEEEKPKVKKLTQKEAKQRLTEFHQKSSNFDKEICHFPTQANRVKSIYAANPTIDNCRYLIECGSFSSLLSSSFSSLLSSFFSFSFSFFFFEGRVSVLKKKKEKEKEKESFCPFLFCNDS